MCSNNDVTSNGGGGRGEGRGEGVGYTVDKSIMYDTDSIGPAL